MATAFSWVWRRLEQLHPRVLALGCKLGEPEAKMHGDPHTLTPLELHLQAREQLLEPRR